MERQQVFDVAAVRGIIAERGQMAGAMLPILHGIQDRIGYIPSDAVALIAAELNVSRAEVHGVISFYHYFRQQAPARHVVQVCRAEACQARGGEALADAAQNLLGCGFHESSGDGQFMLEPVYCLGQCACGPNVTIDDQLHARVDAAKLQRLVQAKRGT
ncbi:formate dehydrogenase subunit gamma [Herbaspirillum sp. alder98]|uniref:formate dehydrogenase subunit gamma n=1 Tax=Herbaspirillum sp. alder98 TaxID=2913096 RepID=UPI001CD8E537|nr:formate dehydrogenase subunit gamma [Herbaspirillum sp. alder98]MCA1324638.1 formate dehydrogenase subunit gamma [Herbaspirillum sp. alder98]